MKKLIVANWKMQLGPKDSEALAKKMRSVRSRYDIVLAPEYLAIDRVAKIIKGSRIALGAQDCAQALSGAYTGEVSAANLKALGVKYVITGHSERRQLLNESSEIINLKLKSALEAGLAPILCIGETKAERKAGKTGAVLKSQIAQALKDLKTSKEVIIAYEPVWAISSQKGAEALAPEQAGLIHKYISEIARQILKRPVRVLYGGSASEKNAAQYLAQPEIAGLLIGSASQKYSSLKAIIS